MARKRDYCFTDFVCDENFLQGLPFEYLCYGKEVCPNTGKSHLQGYIYFKNAKSFSAVQKLLTPRHIEAAKGSTEDSVKYCSKDGDFYEFGVRPKQGSRTDIHNMNELIQQGNCTMRDIVSSVTSFQSVRMAEIKMKYFEPARDWKTQVYWFYGKSGTGKTKKAFEMCDDPYMCMEDNKWWEGYDGHEDVIIDDYRRDFCKFKVLLQLLDRYPMRVECKGGSRQFRAKRLFITTPKSPRETWESRTDEELYQLFRRIDFIEEFV